MVMSVPGCGERDTRGINRTRLGPDWDNSESFLKNGEAKINILPGDIR